VIGALCTPVTHAIMPVTQAARIPLVIATSAGQDFVDASGAGGDEYAFKTIPSEVDIARGLFQWLATKHVKSVAIVTDKGGFFESNGLAWANAAPAVGMRVITRATLPESGTDFAALLGSLKGAAPDELVLMLGPSTGAFFRAYEASGWKVPVTGRLDVAGALAAVSPAFVAAGGLAELSSITVFSPVIDLPGVRDFVEAYEAHYGIVPTQRPFFVYEAVNLVVDAIRRAGSDQPAAIEAALKTSTMPSLLGGSYAPDAHNHPRLPLWIIGARDGKPAVIATE
jgi:branched-chain amino acid transport system substrate-binding protein